MARVFIVDDSLAIREKIKQYLEMDGHQVVSEDESLEGALEEIEKMERGKIDLAIINGNLGVSAEDGELVATALKAKLPGIKIIGFSGNKVIFGDSNLRKTEIGKLLPTIKELGL